MKLHIRALCALVMIGIGVFSAGHIRTSRADGIFAAEFHSNGGWIPSPTLGIHDALPGMRLTPSDAAAFEISAASAASTSGLPLGSPRLTDPINFQPPTLMLTTPATASLIAATVRAQTPQAEDLSDGRLIVQPVPVVAAGPPEMLLPRSFAAAESSCGDPLVLADNQIARVNCSPSRTTIMLGSTGRTEPSVRFDPLPGDTGSHLRGPIIMSLADATRHLNEGTLDWLPADEFRIAQNRYQVAALVGGGLAPRSGLILDPAISDTAIATVEPATAPLMTLASAGQ